MAGYPNMHAASNISWLSYCLWWIEHLLAVYTLVILYWIDLPWLISFVLCGLWRGFLGQPISTPLVCRQKHPPSPYADGLLSHRSLGYWDQHLCHIQRACFDPALATRVDREPADPRPGSSLASGAKPAAGRLSSRAKKSASYGDLFEAPTGKCSCK